MTDLLPNLGGEEGPGWRNLLAEPAVLAQARLWRLLFAEPARLLHVEAPCGWPADLGAPPEAPAFPWLAASDAVVPWIVTEDAAGDRRVSGRALAGPSPETVLAVHDKAFAHAVASDEGLLPAELRDCIAVLDPETLRGADGVQAIEAILAGWPAWARERFTLKPRIGSSGRGRVAGRGGRLDPARLGSALERLAARRGALLEPWLTRTADLSVQLHLGAESVTMLGSLEPLVSPSGRWVGHRGELDSRGRVFSGHAHEEDLREAAARVGAAARERGYTGPCGIDAFVFEGPEGPESPEGGEPILRPVVELNARFTTGIVTIGLLRRALPRVKELLGLGPGERMAFQLWLDLAGADREELEARVGEAGSAELLLELDDAGPAHPALLFHRLP